MLKRHRFFHDGLLILAVALFPALLFAGDCDGPDHLHQSTSQYVIDIYYPSLPDLDLGCEVRRDIDSDLFQFKSLMEGQPAHPRHKARHLVHYFYYHSLVKTKSVLLRTLDDTGGAHPISHTRTYTYDTSTGKKIFFLDLFKADADWHAALWPFVQKTLWPLNKDKKWIEQGASADPENYSRFTLQGAKLVLYFEPYAVAPYSKGTIEVFIPLDQLSDVLSDAFAQRL